MKKSTSFYLLILLIFCSQNISAQITLSSQAEVDAWDQSITILTDSLIITGSDITNIDALSNLVDVTEVLQIRGNPQLINIDGLIGLESITGLIDIIQNNTLVSIDGFLGLMDFDGRIQLQFNDALTNINGFSNLKDVSGLISLWNNDGLLNIDGFSNLEKLSGNISITNSDLLTNLDGLKNIGAFTGSLKLTGNAGITDLDIFSNYTDITGSLIINGAGSQIDLEALSSLTDVSGSLNLSRIESITDLDIFSNIINLSGSISLSFNDNLVSIDGFSNLQTIDGRISLSSNPALTNIDGFSNLNNLIGELAISRNESLSNINGLSSLSDIAGELVILENHLLSNLNALSDLTDIQGELSVLNNNGLVNLDDLASLMRVTGYLIIKDNIGITNWDGISSFEDIEGTLSLINNDGLIDLDIFSNLIDISGIVNISSNLNLVDISGFSNLENITGRLNIGSNDALENLDSFSNLSVIDGRLILAQNNSLTKVDGFPVLDTINGHLILTNNAILENIDDLFNQTELSGGSTLQIERNPSLTNLDGLSGIANADGNLFIFENSALTDIGGFSFLTEISTTADIRLIENNALTNLDGFSNLVRIQRHLNIINNSSLSNIDGLSNLQEIIFVGHLELSNNNSLENIDGLSGLKYIDGSFGGGRLTIQNNSNLKNLDGLYELEIGNADIKINGNHQLNACCGLKEVIKNGNDWDFDISDNKYPCNSAEEILDVCSITLFYDLIRPCEGLDNGRFNFFASDYDTLPFLYQWEETSLGQSGSRVSDSDYFFIDNLAAGIYDVTVSLPNGARETFRDIVLDPIEGSVFEITSLTSTNSTNETASGSIDIEYSGGRAPYALEWLGPNPDSRSNILTTSYTMFGLGPGEYSIQLTDADGQTKNINITLLDDTVPVFPCNDPLDLVILSDVSGSVDAIEYDESKTFFIDLLKVANIGEGEMKTQACIIEWASSNQQSLVVPLTGNLSELEAYQIATRAFSGGTSPHPAMQYGYDYIESIGRSDVEKVLILSTDGHASPSLIAFADEFKAEGYHIVTIAFDDAYANGNIRDILTQVASVPLASPGAPSYSTLDANLADDIVNLYLCPLAPGESSSVYFHRDGVMAIDSIQSFCPAEGLVNIYFTVSAERELAIPASTKVTFYHNNPLVFGATPILTYSLPCAIPVGESMSHTVTLPVNSGTKIYALLNDDGTRLPPLQYPITTLDEIAFTNNIDTITVCVEDQPTIQALKYTTTPISICDSILMYTIDVCNIGTTDAVGVIVNDIAPEGSILTAMVVNDNGCTFDNGDSYNIPTGCCVSLSLTYNVSEVTNGYYGSQNVELSGPTDQEYINYDGSQSSSEDVTIEEGIDNCPSTEIWFTKEVNSEEVCEDDFLVYTYTIHNETNSVIHGARFIDELPEPMMWVYKPYFLNGLSINTQELSGTIAEFIIDEIPADTIATFQIDAYTGEWLIDGMVSSAASLDNVIDLENGGTQTLQSNTVNTIVYENAGTICDSLWTNTLGVGQLESVILFPNPTTGAIKFKNLNESVNYRLLSYTGQIYEEGEYVGGELQLGYEGVNLVQLILDGEIKTFKVLKIGEGR